MVWVQPTKSYWINRVVSSYWRRVSLIGERLGWDSWTYNAGVFQFFHDTAIKSAPGFADAVLAAFPGAKRIIDVGCGSGAMAAELRRRGTDTRGIEHSPKGREWATKQGVPIGVFLLRQDGFDLPPGTPFDLAYSCEVAEHIPTFLSDAFVKFMTACAPTLLVTAAQPGQGGTGHINEQPKSFWITKFEARGYDLDKERTARVAHGLNKPGVLEPMHKNVMVFVKR